jgi:hypothetical protein
MRISIGRSCGKEVTASPITVIKMAGPTVTGFLEDYSFSAEAFIALYNARLMKHG